MKGKYKFAIKNCPKNKMPTYKSMQLAIWCSFTQIVKMKFLATENKYLNHAGNLLLCSGANLLGFFRRWPDIVRRGNLYKFCQFSFLLRKCFLFTYMRAQIQKEWKKKRQFKNRLTCSNTKQCLGSVFIWSWSSILVWLPIRIFFLSEIAIYLSLGLHKRRLSYRRSLQP